MKYALIGCGRIAINHVKAVILTVLSMKSFCPLDFCLGYLY